MKRKDWLELAEGPVDSSRIDDLEALAKAHENMAYRYRSAASLLRKRASESLRTRQQPTSDAHDHVEKPGDAAG